MISLKFQKSSLAVFNITMYTWGSGFTVRVAAFMCRVCYVLRGVKSRVLCLVRTETCNGVTCVNILTL